MKRPTPSRKWGTYPLVLIEWIDSATNSRWMSVADYEASGMRCRTVGWLINETNGLKTVVQTHCADDESSSFCGLMEIPAGAVTKLTKLR